MNALQRLQQAAHNPGPLVLTRDDIHAILAHIAALCRHPKCEHCGDDICIPCGASEPAHCPDRHLFEDHCTSCVGHCGICRWEVVDCGA